MKIIKTTNIIELTQLLPLIESIEIFYPDIKHWYLNKVIPRVVLNKNNIVFIAKNESGNLIGFIIGKDTKKEKKICCVMILPEYRNNGYAIKLIEEMQKELKTNKPHCSVSEDMLPLYEKIFIKHFNWELKEVISNLYVEGKKEYFFNSPNVKKSKI